MTHPHVSSTVEFGHGNLNWRRGERVSDRYGYVCLLDGDDTVQEFTDAVDAARDHQGIRGSLYAEVLEPHRSDHIGDIASGHRPLDEPLAAGAKRTLGTGFLSFEEDEFGPQVGLKPDRGPEPPTPQACPVCGPPTGGGYGRINDQDAGDGSTVEARAIAESFYAFDAPESLRWADKMGQAEIDNLIECGRLRVWRNGKWHSQPRTAEEVNAQNRRGAKGLDMHDGINRMIAVEFRCKQLGIETICPRCEGHGWLDMEAVERWSDWDPKRNWLDTTVLYELHTSDVRLWFEEAHDAA